MRKILWLLLLLLLLPLLSAVQINLNSNFSQGETLTSQIFGNFINSIQPENILLYEGHVRVSFIPYVSFDNGTYYIYGQLTGKSPGNYSLVLSGITYFESGKTKSEDVSKNFTILNNTADFSIDPGFVNTKSSESFFINAQNLGGDILYVNSYLSNGLSDINGSSANYSILPGETKKIDFSVSKIDVSKVDAVLKTVNTSYIVPVFLSPHEVNYKNNSALFEVNPSEMNVSLPVNSSTARYIYIYNMNQLPENVSASASENLIPFLIFNSSVLVGSNSTLKLQINIFSGSNETFEQGTINLTSGNFARQVPFLLNVSKNYIPFNGSSVNNSQSLFENCAQLGGTKCNSNETCSGETKNAQDGICCLGTCKVIQENNSGKIIGWFLVGIIVVALAVFFIKRYSKAKRRPINLLGFTKKK